VGDREEGLTGPMAINKMIVDAREMEGGSPQAGQERRVGLPASARCGGQAGGRVLGRRSYAMLSMVLGWRALA